MARWSHTARRVAAQVLTVTLLAQLIVQSPGTALTSQSSVSSIAPATQLGEFVEDVTQRNTFRKVFSNGSETRVVLSMVPLHIQTEPGVWSEVDNTLVAESGAFAFRNKLNHFDVHFTSSPAGNQLRFERKDRAVTFDLNDHTYGQGAVDTRVTGNKIHYEQVGAPVSLEYEVGGVGLMENIWLKRAGAPAEFHFTFTTEGVTPEARADGSIWFVYDDSVTERAFYIPAPFAEDASGVQIGAEQELKPLGNGRWSLRISVSRQWLTDAERAFPVRIDPELYADLDGGQWLELNSAGTTWSDQRFVSVYSTTRTAHMQFDLRDFPKYDNQKLTRADLHLSIQKGTGCDGNCSGTMMLAQEQQEWYKNYATWTRPRWLGSQWTGGEACTTSDCVPPIQLSFGSNFESGSSGGSVYYERRFDVTPMVQKWLDGSVANNGFLLYNSNKTIKLVSPTWQCCTTVSSSLELYYANAAAPSVTLEAAEPTNPVATVVADAALVKTELYVDGVLAGSIPRRTSGTYSFTIDETKFPFGSHRLKARVYTIAGQTAESAPVITTFGHGGVTPPVNLAAYPVTGGGMRLTWAAASASHPEDRITYTVTRSSDSAFSSPVELVSGLTSPTWVDMNVTGLPYYKVQAVSSAGVRSVSTPAVQAQPPVRPFNLEIRNMADGSLLLNWTPSPTGFVDSSTTYELVRHPDQYSPGTVIAQGITATAFKDTTVTPGIGYTYGVTAKNGAGQVSQTIYAGSPRVSVYSAPDAPSDFQVTSGRGRNVQLTWTPLPDPGTTYEIKQCPAGVLNDYNCTTFSGLGGGAWTAEPSSLTEGQRYVYFLRTVQGGAAGPWSLPRGATVSTRLRTGFDARQASMDTQFGSLPATVNLSGGNLAVSTTDSSIQMPYLPQDVRRTYNSQEDSGMALGKGWRLNVEWKVVEDESVTVVIEGNGTEHHFTWNGSEYVPETWYSGRLNRDTQAQGWTLSFPNLLTYTFDAAGNLVRIQEQNGNQLVITNTDGKVMRLDSAPVQRAVTFQYDPLTGQLSSVRDSVGRVTTYGYNIAGLLDMVTNHAGESAHYDYDNQARLIRVVDAAGRWNYIVYGSSDEVRAIVDGLGNITNLGTPDRLTLSTLQFTGVPVCDVRSGPPVRATITDPLGNTTRVGMTDEGWASEVVEVKQYLSVTDAGCTRTTMGYTMVGNTLSMYTITNPRGLITDYTLDAFGRITEAFEHPSSAADTQDLVAPGVTHRISTVTYDSLTGAQVDAVAPVENSTYHGTASSYMYAVNDQFPYRLSSATVQSYVLASDGSRTNVGGITRYTFDASDDHPGWVTQVVDPNGYVTDLSYNDDGTLRSVTKRSIDADLVAAGVQTSSRDVVQEFTYESDGQIRDIVEWHQAETQGQAVTHTDYDAMGRPVAVTAPDGARSYTLYDPSGMPLMTIDQAGRTQVQFTDGALRPAEVVAADGGITRFGYDAAGRNTSVTDPLNHVTTMTYDAAGRVIRVIDPNSIAHGYRYDRMGNVVAVTSGSATVLDQGKGYEVRASYYLSGLLRQTKEPLPTSAITTTTGIPIPPTEAGDPTDTTYNTTTYQYNLLGQQIDTTDANGNHVGYFYDELGRLSRVIQYVIGGDLTTSYGYDLNGNRTSVTDARQKTTNFRYDGLNRMWRQVDPRGVTTQEYRFDAAGNLSQLMEPRQIDSKVFTTTTTYSYDLAHRLVRTSFQRSITGTNTTDDPVTLNRTYAYDGAGNRVFMWDGRAHNFYAYDLMGRLREERSQWQVVSYGYDLASRLTSVTSRLGQVTYAYDAGNRVSTVTDPFSNKTTYTYDANYGMLTSLKLPLGSPNSVTRNDLYYQLSDGRLTNRLKQRTFTKTISGWSSQVWQGTYTYDLPGNIRTFKDSTPLNQTYTYDQAYRLIQADGASGNSSHPNSRYRYDPDGNRSTWGNEVDTSGNVFNYDSSNLKWTITQTTDDADRVTVIDEVQSSTKQIKKQFQYENNGNTRNEYWKRTGYSDPCSSTGGFPDRSVTTYFDDANLLVTRHEIDNLRTTNRDNLTTYTHDGDGRRLSQLYQQIDYAGSSGSCTEMPAWAEITLYEYANGEVLNERTGGDIPVWYIRDPQGGLLYTLHWRTDKLQPDAYVTDILGSIRMLLDYTGSVANRYQYDAYGTITSSASTLRNSYTFTGYGLDQRSALYNAKARYYRPDLGRFMTQDTWKGSPWQPWTQNLYAYVHNNPVNFVDPTGHKEVDYAGGGGGGLEVLWALYQWATMNSTDITQTAIDVAQCASDPSVEGCAQLVPDAAALVAPGPQATGGSKNGGLPDDAKVVRGGESAPKTLLDNQARDPRGHISCNVGCGGIDQLATIPGPFPNASITETTVGQIRALGEGWDVVPDPTPSNPLHGSIVPPSVPMTPSQAAALSGAFTKQTNIWRD